MNCGELATTAMSRNCLIVMARKRHFKETAEFPDQRSSSLTTATNETQHLCTGPGISAICEIATDAMLNSIFRLPYPQLVRRQFARAVRDNLMRDELA